jgi:acyl-CoA dehydrogenase
MNFELSDRCGDYQRRLISFMDEHVYPAEPIYEQQMHDAGDDHFQPPVLEELKTEAKRRGLWNLFHPNPEWGPGLTNVEYAPLAEIMGRSLIGPEACNCSAPDTGNMEILNLFGTEEHKRRWLQPLLDGTIRSGFAMTEPGAASSDAANIELSIQRVDDSYILNGRKWFTSGALHRNCKVLIVMGTTDPTASSHQRHSMLVVPLNTPGITVVRGLLVFGYQEREGHAEILFENVRVPTNAILAGEGEGFMIGQARLGPGRIHHAMRSVGMAERALQMLCTRAQTRSTFGQLISDRANIQDWIAESRIDIEMIRLLTMKAAWLMDTAGNRHARAEIAAIKVAAPNVATRVLDRAIQVHGGGGVSQDFPLAQMWVHQRALRLADGPDEVHKRTIALRELRHNPAYGDTLDLGERAPESVG